MRALKPSAITNQLIAAARDLSVQVDRMRFKLPITHVYNPLHYAWRGHELYLRKFGTGKKRVLFLGMNPGPFGMAQTGVPFGEVAAVRDWMQIHALIGRPALEHPRRPIHGFDCARSEVSGRRLWQLFAEKFPSANDFFAEHFVVNYCPLIFCETTGRNRTPDKLPRAEKDRLFAACDEHLARVVEILEPEWMIGIGAFAFDRAGLLLRDSKIKLGAILHPSPASPAANRDWARTATQQLIGLGVWRGARQSICG